MKRLKILVYGDQNLNIMDGSAVWLTSLTNILSHDGKADVSVLLKTPIRRQQVISNIKDLDYIKLINPFELFKNKKFKSKHKMNAKEASTVINKLDKEHEYDIVITRGKEITEYSLRKSYHKKLIPYITDFNHQKKRSKDMNFFKMIYKQCPNVFVQTDEMKQLLTKNLKVSPEKFITLPPSVDDVEVEPSFEIDNFSFVYTGKFAEEWKTEEMIRAFTKAKSHVDTLTLNIAGDKFQGPLAEKKANIIYDMENLKGINWVGAISRKESLDLVKASDLGFAYRSESIDNDKSVELSTKFLEYGINGKPVVVRKIKQYENLLGEDYPLYCNSYDELVDKLILAFTDKEVYRKAALACYKASQKYQFSNVSSRILDRLSVYNEAKPTILFAGHDFKFLNWYINHCKQSNEYNVVIDKWTGHNAHDYDKSMELLKQADIIFCEWGLGNAEFYSNNKLRGQELYIRVHRQELTTGYLSNVNYQNVTSVIAISPHIYEEFNRIKRIPRSKMKVIPNMVDVDRFNVSKEKDHSFNIGILGIIPELKRLDRAINVFEKLWETDSRYNLFIKGKFPEDLPWMKNRPEEMRFYDDLFSRIEQAPWKDSVIFDGHGDDVGHWFSRLNFILSTSDIESFHLAPMEGMASGTVPIVFNWPGADTLYPENNIVKSEEEAVNLILKETNTPRYTSQKYQSMVEKYNKQTSITKLNNLIFN